MAIQLQNASEEEENYNATINTTPLVDVMLVLLIIFLITLPVISAHTSIRLPTEPAQSIDAAIKPVTVSINFQGEIMLDTQIIADIGELIFKLKQLPDKSKLQAIHITADAQLPYKTVRQVIAALHHVGMNNITLVTQQSSTTLQ